MVFIELFEFIKSIDLFNHSLKEMKKTKRKKKMKARYGYGEETSVCA